MMIDDNNGDDEDDLIYDHQQQHAVIYGGLFSWYWNREWILILTVLHGEVLDVVALVENNAEEDEE